MKRSEAISKVAQKLLDLYMHGQSAKDANDAWDEWADAEAILLVLEEAGMLPPMQEIPEFKFQSPHQWDDESTVSEGTK